MAFTAPRRSLLALAALCLIVGQGCQTLSRWTSPNAEPEYAADAELNLKRGQDALKSKSYPEAEKYFEHVKTKYPFLEAAKTAELLLADTAFERETWSDARDRYKNFVKGHPTHPKVDYAAYRAALTHYKDLPTEFFLLPPSEEKDMTEVKNALKAMQEFVRAYPNSSFLPEAQKTIDDARRRLALHEVYVARFYAKRERWVAVVSRIEGLVEQYPGIQIDAEVADLIDRGYAGLKAKDKAQAALKRIVERFPGTKGARRAKELLGS